MINPYKIIISSILTITMSGCGGDNSSNPTDTQSTEQFTVTASAGTGGSIAPASLTVDSGAEGVFTLTPETGYIVDTISDCGGTLSANSYTITSITSDCELSISFNALPVITIEGVDSIFEGENVTLTASATDTDGVVSSFEWSQVSGTEVTLANTNLETLEFVTPDIATDETLVFALKVTDDKGGETSAQFSLAVINERAFILVFRVDAGQEITIPTDSSLTYDYTVDWGDDTDISTESGNAVHNYIDAGDYNVKILGTFPTIAYLDDVSGEVTDCTALVNIKQWGTNKWSTMSSAFSGCNNVNSDATDAPDLSLVTSASFMFFDATVFDGDISGWTVNNITDMSSMFRSASAFNQDLNAWDVSNVTNMGGMFSHATSFNGDISSWDVSNVTDMSFMFSLATAFNADISSWVVSSVTNMRGMVRRTIAFNQDISSWDVGSVTDMSFMFSRATAFNQDISSWNVSNVTDMSTMFADATAFNQDISSWDVGSVTDMSFMFSLATAFNQDISTWNVTNVINSSGFNPNPAMGFVSPNFNVIIGMP